MNEDRMRLVITEIVSPDYARQIKEQIGAGGRNYYCSLPNYLGSQDSMACAEKKLTNDHNGYGSWAYYRNTLAQICGSHAAAVSATAHQRAEAYIKAFNRWEEESENKI